MSTATQSRSTAAGKGSNKDFWLLYPSSNSDKTFADALCALYYLPENYKLLILTDGTAKADASMPSHSDLKARVKFEQGAGLSGQASPFSFAHALISDDATPDIIKQTIKSQVIVSAGAKSDLEPSEYNSFTVSTNNPLALASAVLRIAHTA